MENNEKEISAFLAKATKFHVLYHALLETLECQVDNEE